MAQRAGFFHSRAAAPKYAAIMGMGAFVADTEKAAGKVAHQ